MKQNIHKLNGLEFIHERDFANGQWVHFWYFRPLEQSEWHLFSLPTGKTRKSDIENLLKSREEVTKFYLERLRSAFDVEGAKRYLLSAKQAWERISSPDWGGRGSNPNRDAKRVQQVRETFESAKVKLEKAKILRERLNSNQQRGRYSMAFSLPAIQQIIHGTFL